MLIIYILGFQGIKKYLKKLSQKFSYNFYADAANVFRFTFWSLTIMITAPSLIANNDANYFSKHDSNISQAGAFATFKAPFMNKL